MHLGSNRNYICSCGHVQVKHVMVGLLCCRSRSLLEQRTQELTAVRTKCQVLLS